MKMKVRSLLAAVVTALLVVSLAPVLPVHADDPTMRLAIEEQTATPGGDVTVTVAMTENPGIIALKFTLDWNSASLTLKSVDKTGGVANYGSDLSTENMPDVNLGTLSTYTFSTSNDTAQQNYTATGKVMTLTFGVSGSHAGGAETLTFSITGADIIDKDMVTVPSAATDGTVKVVKPLAAAVSVSLAAPVQDETAQTVISETTYTGTVSWSPALNAGKFQQNKSYTATVSLEPADAYHPFANPSQITVNGEAPTAVTTNTAQSLVFTKTFSATAKKNLTVAGATATARPYDGTTAVTITGATLQGVEPEDTVTATYTGATASAGVGDDKPVTVTVTLAGADKDSYTVTPPAGVTVNITKATAVGVPRTRMILKNQAHGYAFNLSTLLPALPSGCVWGGTPTYKVSTVSDTANILANAPNVDDLLTSPYTIQVVSTASDTPATLTVTVSSPNYADFDAVITVQPTDKAPVSIDGVTTPDRTYDAQPYAFSGTPALTDTVNGGAVSGVTLEALYTGRGNTTYSDQTAPAGVGDYTLTLAVPAANAAYTGDASFDFSVTPAPVTVTAADKRITVGKPLPAFTYTQSPAALFGTDTWATLPTASCPTADANTKGTYPITVAGGVLDANYTVTYVPGTLTVAAATSGGGGGGGSSSSATTGTQTPQTTTPQTQMPSTNTGAGTGANAGAFSDAKTGDWFYGDVKFVTDKGLFRGTSATEFSPNAAMTRGMIVTVLHRLANEPAAAGTSRFSDVASGQYYANAVAWASSVGVVSGYGGGVFGAEGNITRQDLAVILLRYAELSGITLPETRAYPGFGDAAGIADYAKNAVEALYRAGVVSGKPGEVFDPKGNATRAEVAAMLRRFAELIQS